MKRFLLSAAILFSTMPVWSQVHPGRVSLNVREIDGNPSAYPVILMFQNGTLTTDANGTTVTVQNSGGGGGGSSGISIYQGSAFIAGISSLAFQAPLTITYGGSVATVTLDITNLPPGATNYIWNTTGLQAGATFYVTSGTVQMLNISSSVYIGGFPPGQSLAYDGSINGAVPIYISTTQYSTAITLDVPDSAVTGSPVLQFIAHNFGNHYPFRIGIKANGTSAADQTLDFNDATGLHVLRIGQLTGRVGIRPTEQSIAPTNMLEVGGGTFVVSDEADVSVGNIPPNTGFSGSKMLFSVRGQGADSTGFFLGITTFGRVGIGNVGYTSRISSLLDIGGGSVTIRGAGAGLQIVGGPVVAASGAFSGSVLISSLVVVTATAGFNGVTYYWPTSLSANNCLKVDAGGLLSWATCGSGGGPAVSTYTGFYLNGAYLVSIGSINVSGDIQVMDRYISSVSLRVDLSTVTGLANTGISQSNVVLATNSAPLLGQIYSIGSTNALVLQSQINTLTSTNGAIFQSQISNIKSTNAAVLQSQISNILSTNALAIMGNTYAITSTNALILQSQINTIFSTNANILQSQINTIFSTNANILQSQHNTILSTNAAALTSQIYNITSTNSAILQSQISVIVGTNILTTTVITEGSMTAKGTFTSTTGFVGIGSSVTQINVLNVSSGILPIIFGGTGISSNPIVEIPLSPASWAPTLSSGGPVVQTIQYSTTCINFDVMVFSSKTQATTQYYQQEMSPASGWDGSTVSFYVTWLTTESSTAGSAAFSLEAVALGNGNSIFVPYGSSVTVTQAWTANNTMMKTAESASLTIGGSPAPGNSVWWRIHRDITNPSDNLNARIMITGVRLRIKKNRWTDY